MCESPKGGQAAKGYQANSLNAPVKVYWLKVFSYLISIVWCLVWSKSRYLLTRSLRGCCVKCGSSFLSRKTLISKIFNNQIFIQSQTSGIRQNIFKFTLSAYRFIFIISRGSLQSMKTIWRYRFSCWFLYVMEKFNKLMSSYETMSNNHNKCTDESKHTKLKVFPR